MDLFRIMQNIRGINIEEEIKNAIYMVRNVLRGLTKNQTCAIYSSYLFEEMKRRHLNVRLINTLDLNLNFEHYFILINNEGEFYLADLTYEQFNNHNFDNLLINGYMKINDNILNDYLNIIERKQVSCFTCDGIFYMDIKDRKR